MIDLKTGDDGVAELVLGRDPCNEIGTEMVSLLEAVLETLDVDRVHTLIIRSAVRGGFSAGGQLRILNFRGGRSRSRFSLL